MTGNISKVLGSVVAATLLSSCQSMGSHMTNFATDYNRVIADTRNEMILLNILRAHYNEPTHYSSLSTVQGNISAQAQANSGFSEDGPIENVTAGLELQVRSSPSFTIVPLSSAEFSRGILRPIEPAIITLFLDQGWNEGILAALFIENISCGDQIYENDPEDFAIPAGMTLDAHEERLNDRGRLSHRQVLSLGFRRTPPPSPQTSNSGKPSPVPAGAIATITPESGDALGALVEHMDSTYRMAVRQAGEAITFDVFNRSRDNLSITFNARSNELPESVLPADVPPSCIVGDNDILKISSTNDVSIRSVDSVVYYLGEILRHPGTMQFGSLHGLPRMSSGIRVTDTVFALHTEGSVPNYSVSVSHHGRRFYVPVGTPSNGSRDRTIQVLSLINQLISLQTSNDALQRPPTSLSVN